MKGLILLVLLPLSSYAQAPNCQRLQEIARSFESEVLGSALSNCKSETLPDLQLDETAKAAILKDYSCAKLGVLEEKINSLKNQLSLVEGFRILKESIQANKEATADNSLTQAQRAGTEFVKGLKTAQSLELLLNTTSGSTPLINELKAIPVAQRDTPDKFKKEVSKLCKSRSGRTAETVDACSASFSPDASSITEINTLFERGSLDEDQLNSWRDALDISLADGSEYSFQDMDNDLKEAIPKIASGKLTLNRDELKKIKNLPDFKDADALPFLAQMRAGKSLNVQKAMESFKFLNEDLKNRLQVETRAKISWAWNEVRDSSINLEAPQRAVCEEAKKDFEKSRECWASLSTAGFTDSVDLDKKDFLQVSLGNGLKSSFTYLEKLNGVSACLTDAALAKANNGDQLTNCAEINMLTADKDDVQAKLTVLEELAKKIQKEKENKIKLRDFTLEKIGDLKCLVSNISVVECEEQGVFNIAPQAMELTSDLLGMAMVHPPTSETDIEAICDDSPEGMEVDLCRFYDPEPEHPNTTNPPLPSDESPYLNVSDARDTSRDAAVDGISTIGWGILQALSQPQTYWPNPYMNYNPNPYVYNSHLGLSGLSPSDQLLTNARYSGGYGVYTPTFGAAPYTAFPGISSYVTSGSVSSGNTSSYFSNFATYY